MKLKNYQIPFILFFSLFVNPTFSNVKIVYIDMDKILYTSKVGSLFVGKIDKKEKKLLDNFNSLKIKIQDKEKNILKQKNIISEEEFRKKVNEIKLEINNFNQEKRKAITDLQNLRVNSTEKFLKELNPILSKYSNDNSISIILQKKNLIIGKSELDVTDKILKIVDSTMKEIKIKWQSQL